MTPTTEMEEKKGQMKQKNGIEEEPPFHAGTRIALQHITSYQYDRLIKLGEQTVRLYPAPHCPIPIHSYSLKIKPENHFINWGYDPCGNKIAKVVIPEKTDLFEVEVGLIADLLPVNPFLFFPDSESQHYPFHYEQDLILELAPYLHIDEQDAFLVDWIQSQQFHNTKLMNLLVEINKVIKKTIKYVIRLEPGVQSCNETLSLESGSCRDMAWLLCNILRHLGIAARFTSGYLVQLKQWEKPLDGPPGPERDFCDLHAWVEAFVPGGGWIGLDPTSGFLASQGHLPLCSTPTYARAAPIAGILEKCESKMHHTMDVKRIQERSLSTRPYNDAQWKDIYDLGVQVDEELKKEGVELTMGGEPTFVSSEERNHIQWHYAALGKEKREKSEKLLKRLKKRFAPNGIFMSAQGKWYPDEVLPRWSLNCYWRKDRVPLWENEELLQPPASGTAVSINTAKEFIENVAKELEMSEACVWAAFEDPAHLAWKEYTLPYEDMLCDLTAYPPGERLRLAQNLEKEAAFPSGFVLPLYFSAGKQRWCTAKWKFKANKLFLIPGESPLGLRLPLHRIRHVEKSQIEMIDMDAHQAQCQVKDNEIESKTVEKTLVTALSGEVREGKLYLFLPPLTEIESFIKLIRAIETVAKKMGQPIILEGYPPPEDPLIQNFNITPDPGVIEVNIHPAQNWNELVEITTTLYEEARLTRLTPEKFLLNGRACGTEGGSHILIGGKTFDSSPFFVRPDLLVSMITFWQHHPSLSYFFSTRFIGPDSQAPRVDETRHDSLYNLELAIQHFPKRKNLPFWILERYFSYFLTDVSGNTHRAELCIDKLYNSEAESGRLGLVELRAFEMQPNPRMALSLCLLIRTLAAYLLKYPYKRPLIPWGTTLHDKYLLPYYLWEDLRSIIKELNEAGFPFLLDWLRPHYDFQFPIIGCAYIDNMMIELRTALEPWPVLKEERTGVGGVSRGVDSSMERVQVRFSGYAGERYVLACNGHRVPLKPTGRKEEYVAGIRSKTWSPPSTSHPYLPCESPLVFDLIDTYNQRSVGGCTYHFSNPGGHNYQHFPEEAEDADARRRSMFFPNYSPGKIDVSMDETTHEDFPNTLDLRYKYTK